MSGTEVPGVGIDAARLGDWIAVTLGGAAAPVQITRIKGGQSNPTYLVTRGRDRYVLRRKPSGTLVPSAHAVDREYRVMAALAASDVPVARVHALCEDDSVIGTAFYLMEFVEGRVLWDPALPGVSPAERGRMYDELNRVIAALHAVDPTAVGIADYGRHGDYIVRQGRRWRRQARHIRPPRRIHRAAGQPLEPAVPGIAHREHRRHGSPHRLVARARARRRRDADRAWRLPPRQRDLSPEQAADRRCARLGVDDTRSSALGLRLSLHGLAGRAR